LDIGEGEIFGIMGRSHAGKSTLMRCINVLDRPTRGSVYIDKYPLLQMCPTELRMARRNIGMISQHTHLLSSRTVYDNVALLEIIGLTGEIAQRVPILLETVGLIDKAEVYRHNSMGCKTAYRHCIDQSTLKCYCVMNPPQLRSQIRLCYFTITQRPE
jgi:D-methionine transport system ATP-binding protein